jgi:hypothetical protein
LKARDNSTLTEEELVAKGMLPDTREEYKWNRFRDIYIILKNECVAELINCTSSTLDNDTYALSSSSAIDAGDEMLDRYASVASNCESSCKTSSEYWIAYFEEIYQINWEDHVYDWEAFTDILMGACQGNCSDDPQGHLSGDEVEAAISSNNFVIPTTLNTNTVRNRLIAQKVQYYADVMENKYAHEWLNGEIDQITDWLQNDPVGAIYPNMFGEFSFEEFQEAYENVCASSFPSEYENFIVEEYTEEAFSNNTLSLERNYHDAYTETMETLLESIYFEVDGFHSGTGSNYYTEYNTGYFDVSTILT